MKITFSLTLIPYFMLNTCIINLQHITTQYRNYLQLNHVFLYLSVHVDQSRQSYLIPETNQV